MEFFSYPVILKVMLRPAFAEAKPEIMVTNVRFVVQYKDLLSYYCTYVWCESFVILNMNIFTKIKKETKMKKKHFDLVVIFTSFYKRPLDSV